MHEHDVAFGATLPRIGEVSHHAGQRVEVVGRIHILVDPTSQPGLKAERRSCRHRGTDKAVEHLAVEVVTLVIQRHRGVQRMPRTHDVRDARILRHAVSGVWVLMTRRCVCCASRANTLSRGSTRWSTHGDSSASGAGGSGSWWINRSRIVCTQVVPCLDRVLTTVSPSRKAKPSQRPLSSSAEV